MLSSTTVSDGTFSWAQLGWTTELITIRVTRAHEMVDAKSRILMPATCSLCGKKTDLFTYCPIHNSLLVSIRLEQKEEVDDDDGEQEEEENSYGLVLS